MIDIIGVSSDIQTYDTDVSKAANILSVQIGSLEYAQTLGIDLAYFLDEGLQFQNESFRAYLVEVLANNGINVTSIVEQVEALFTQMNINISAAENNSALVR